MPSPVTTVERVLPLGKRAGGRAAQLLRDSKEKLGVLRKVAGTNKREG